MPRLLEFGVPGFAINNALLGVIAKRLVRKVCEHCAQPDTPDADLLHSLGIDSSHEGSFMKAVGCPKCMSMGYKGRVGVYELFKMTSKIKQLIEASATSMEIAQAARAEGTREMIRDGIDKAMLSLTTLEEIKKLHSTVDAVLAVEPDDAGNELKMSA
ncbi:MAG: hypothetical protein JKY96_06195 [Phycisphaerales bacterium]|nr:hypothetical protein [Phycisphaerales bacterium]